ncbi:MAG TPA: polymer-forming cytoskeletal protein [Myxococcales bacterium]|nr:polymer-forming cytoskeletal protein [Myxococcales bacterium]
MALSAKEDSLSTVIGESILISGNLEGDEDLTIRGRVEGSIRLTKTLIVEASGIVKADVSVKDAVISGVVVGNVTASDSVQITADGRMVGDLSAPRVIIVDGASFRGRVDMGDFDAERKPAGEKSSRPPLRAVPPRPPARPPAKDGASEEKRVQAASGARPPAPPSAPPMPPILVGAKRRVLVKKGKR